MHICFVEIGYPRPTTGIVGGAGTYIKIFANQLVEKGYTISVICGRVNNNSIFYNDGNINVYPVIEYGSLHYFISKIPILINFSKLVRYLETGFKIYRMLRIINYKNKIDLVEYSEGGDFWSALTKKFPYISHLHGSAYTFKKQSGISISIGDWLQRRAELYFIYRANKVVSPSKAMLGYVEAEMNTTLNADVISYPIPDIAKEMLPDIDPTADNSIKVNLIFISRNDPVKGGELLINSIKQLPDCIKNKIIVEFYGYRPKSDISDLNCLSIKGFVSRDKLNKAYQNADICIIPSLFDNSPNTVYEAMAYGKIIVASSVGGIPEIIGDSKNGFLFEPNNIQDLINKITDAIELVMSGCHKEMSQNARERIIFYADLQKNVEKRIALYLK